MRTKTDSRGATTATANESVSEALNPTELEAAETVGVESAWVSSLLEDVDRQTGKKPLKVNVTFKKGDVSSSASAPSPMPRSPGKAMNVLKAAIEKEKEEEKRTKVGKGKHQ